MTVTVRRGRQPVQVGKLASVGSRRVGERCLRLGHAGENEARGRSGILAGCKARVQIHGAGRLQPDLTQPRVTEPGHRQFGKIDAHHTVGAAVAPGAVAGAQGRLAFPGSGGFVPIAGNTPHLDGIDVARGAGRQAQLKLGRADDRPWRQGIAGCKAQQHAAAALALLEQAQICFAAQGSRRRCGV